MKAWKHADISMLHITRKDRRLLDKALEDFSGKWPLSIYKKGSYGWFVYIPDRKEIHQVLCELVKFGFSPEFVSLIQMLSEDKFILLCLDCSGEVLNALSTFEH